MHQELISQAKVDGVEEIWIAALIVNQHQILLPEKSPMNQENGIYEFPGDKLQVKENIFRALKRVVAQLTNLEVAGFLGYVGHVDFYSSAKASCRRFTFAVEVQDPLSIRPALHVAYASSRGCGLSHQGRDSGDD